MNENNNILQQMRTTFEELEKRIKAIERQTGITNQLTVVKGCFEETKQLLEDFESDYNSHITEFSSHIQSSNEFKEQTEQNIQTLTTTQNNQALLINTLSPKVNTLETQMTNLKARVTTLEQGGGSSTGGTNVTSVADAMEICVNHTTDNTTFTSPYYDILAEVGKKVVVQFQFTYDSTATTDSVIKSIDMYVNSKKVKSRVLKPSTVSNEPYTIWATFTPTRKFNAIHFAGEIIGATIHNIHFNVQGVNVEIINKKFPFSITCFNQKYYVCKYNDYDIEYGIFDKDSYTLDSTLTKINKENITTPFINAELRIMSTKNQSKFILDSNFSQGFALFCSVLSSSRNHYVIRQDSSNTDKYITVNNYGGNSYFCDMTNEIISNCGGTSIISFSETSGLKLYDTSNYTFKNITLNGNNVIGYYGNFVKDNNLSPNSTIKFPGMLVMDEDGNVNYFETLNNTYCVNIGSGKNFVGFLQTDGSINVYLNKGANVCKYTLTKNSTTNQYELGTDCTVYTNAQRVEELYDNKLLVFYDNDYEIITQATNE